jgi:hypothetical protein
MTRIACAAVLLLAVGCRRGVDTSREAETLLNTDRAWSQVASSGTNADSVVTFWSEHRKRRNAQRTVGKRQERTPVYGHQ